MSYRHDSDLTFLAECNNDDLDVLVTYLIGPDNDRRITEGLTAKDEFKRYYPDHVSYWPLIAEELQLFGGNTFANVFRGGQGVLYKEILCDVCGKMGVNFNSNASTETIELNLLMKVMTDSLDKMTPQELKVAVEELGLKTTNLTPEAIAAALQVAVRVSGFAAYQTALIVANAVAKAVLGRGLSLAANAGLARVIGIFAGPIGWIITGLWTLIDVAGPAYRVTIPSVVQVAYMRLKSKAAT